MTSAWSILASAAAAGLVAVGLVALGHPVAAHLGTFIAGGSAVCALVEFTSVLEARADAALSKDFADAP